MIRRETNACDSTYQFTDVVDICCPKSSAKLGVFLKITKKVSEKPPILWSIYLKSLILHAVCAIKRTEYKKMAEKKPAKS